VGGLEAQGGAERVNGWDPSDTRKDTLAPIMAAQLTRILSWLPQIKNVPISGTCNVRCILIP